MCLLAPFIIHDTTTVSQGPDLPFLADEGQFLYTLTYTVVHLVPTCSGYAS